MTRKLGKDSKMQKADNVRIMHQNVLLIKEVNDLRHDLKMARADTHDLEVLMGFNSKNRPPDIVSGASVKYPVPTIFEADMTRISLSYTAIALLTIYLDQVIKLILREYWSLIMQMKHEN